MSKTSTLQSSTSVHVSQMPSVRTERSKKTKRIANKIKSKKQNRKNAHPKYLLHVTAGIPNVWEPTTEELDHIATLFNKLMEAAGTEYIAGTVVTRNGIELRLLAID